MLITTIRCLGITLILSIFASSIFAQNTTRLSADYFLIQGRVDDGKPMRIARYLNYSLLKEASSEKASTLTGKERTDYYDKVFAKEDITLKPGNYIIDNHLEVAKFTINEQGKLSGKLKLDNKRHNSETDADLIEGVLQESTTTVNGVVYSKNKLTDSVFIHQRFFPNGKLNELEKTWLVAGSDYKKTIRQEYYNNGQLLISSNGRTGKSTSYYKNGKKERESDEKTGSGAFYNENGKVHRKYYRTKTDTCNEEYTDGLIYSKTCRTASGEKYYYYKKGKLDYYEAYDRILGKTLVYDAKGNKINRESVSDKVPMMISPSSGN